MTTIRKMQMADAEAVLQLWDAAGMELDGNGLTTQESAKVLSVIKRYIQHADLYSLVAEQAGEIVGFVLAYVTAPHPAYEGANRLGEIDQYYVTPAARKTDAGHKLFEQLVSTLRAQGVEVIHTHAREDAPALQEFWQDIGWEKDTVMYSWYAYLHPVAESRAA